MAALLTLGAAGVVIGTRLAATHESIYPEQKKEALVQAGASLSCAGSAAYVDCEGLCLAVSDAGPHQSTIRTTLYDELSDRGWDAVHGVDGRALHTDFTKVGSPCSKSQAWPRICSS